MPHVLCALYLNHRSEEWDTSSYYDNAHTARELPPLGTEDLEFAPGCYLLGVRWVFLGRRHPSERPGRRRVRV